MIGLLIWEGIWVFKQIEKKIEVFEYYYRQQVVEILRATKSLTDIIVDSSKNQLQLIDKVKEDIKLLEEISANLKAKIKALNPIEIKDAENIKKANLQLVNITHWYWGSGSHIKIDGESYVLTCAHLIEDKTDSICVKEDEYYYFLDFVKMDRETDLALFKADYNVKKFPYLEIAEKSPLQGQKVIAIGNPDNMEDVFTDGIIAKIKENSILITNSVFSGNSGGAVLYDGKIVGILKQMLYHLFANSYGVVIKLEDIQEFLERVK